MNCWGSTDRVCFKDRALRGTVREGKGEGDGFVNHYMLVVWGKGRDTEMRNAHHHDG